MTPKNVAKSTKVDRRLAAAAAPRTYTQIKLSQEMIFKLLLWKCSVSAVSPPCRCQQTWLPPWRVCLLFSALKTWKSNTRWVLQAVEVTPRRASTFMPSDDREKLTGDLPTHFLSPPPILLPHSTIPPPPPTRVYGLFAAGNGKQRDFQLVVSLCNTDLASLSCSLSAQPAQRINWKSFLGCAVL